MKYVKSLICTLCIHICIVDYFPKHIYILKVIGGSFLTTSTSPSPLWNQTAKNVFENIQDNEYVRKHGIYDKVIIECAFNQKNLLKKEFSMSKIGGGCDLFYKTLTTNGMCHTFNGKSSSKIWKASEITNEFGKLFSYNQHDEKFGGSGISEGKK